MKIRIFTGLLALSVLLMTGCGDSPVSEISDPPQEIQQEDVQADDGSEPDPTPESELDNSESAPDTVKDTQESSHVWEFIEPSEPDRSSGNGSSSDTEPYRPLNTFGVNYERILAYLDTAAEDEGLAKPSTMRVEEKIETVGDGDGFTYNMKTIYLETDVFLYLCEETVDGMVFDISCFCDVSKASKSSLNSLFFYVIEIIRMLEGDAVALDVLEGLDISTKDSSFGNVAGEYASYSYVNSGGAFFFSAIA